MIKILESIWAFLVRLYGLLMTVWDYITQFFKFIYDLFSALFGAIQRIFTGDLAVFAVPLLLVLSIGLILLILGRK